MDEVEKERVLDFLKGQLEGFQLFIMMLHGNFAGIEFVHKSLMDFSMEDFRNWEKK